MDDLTARDDVVAIVVDGLGQQLRQRESAPVRPRRKVEDCQLQQAIVIGRLPIVKLEDARVGNEHPVGGEIEADGAMVRDDETLIPLMLPLGGGLLLALRT